MTGWMLEAYPPGEAVLRPHPLPMTEAGCTVRLRCLAGATAIHVAVGTDERILARAEIPAEGRERLLIQVSRTLDGAIDIHCPGRDSLRVPEPPACAPAAALRPGRPQETLELALIIDGTSLFFHAPDGRGFSGSPLLADRERWGGLADELCRFVERLAQDHAESRLALFAFGDVPVANATAADLQPAYLLYPEAPADRLLQALRPETLRERLMNLPASSGGDFVDALGDALAACDRLFWSPAARKVAVLVGDSPGHSIEHPVPRSGEASARSHDVDVEALRLFRRGVVMATVYHAPDPGFLDSLIPAQRKLPAAARDQYRRLATLPEFALTAASFDGAAAAAALTTIPGLVGRGACGGEWLGLVEPVG